MLLKLRDRLNADWCSILAEWASQGLQLVPHWLPLHSPLLCSPDMFLNTGLHLPGQSLCLGVGWEGAESAWLLWPACTCIAKTPRGIGPPSPLSQDLGLVPCFPLTVIPLTNRDFIFLFCRNIQKKNDWRVNHRQKDLCSSHISTV